MPAAIVDEIGSIGPPGFMQMARKQVGHLRFDETRHALDGGVFRHRGGQSPNLLVAFVAGLCAEYVTITNPIARRNIPFDLPLAHPRDLVPVPSIPR